MRVLVVKLSSLGDLVHALPAVHALKVGLKADVDWVTQPEYVELVRCFEDVADVMAFPRHSPVRRFARFARQLRLREYDLVVDLQGLLKSAIVCRLARARHVLGPSFHREGSRFLYDAVAGRRNKDRHAVEECLDSVRRLNLPVTDTAFRIRVPQMAPADGHPRIALLPVSRRPNKNWDEERFIEVARALRDRRSAQVVLMGTAADVPVCGEIANAVNSHGDGPAAINLAGRTSLVEMGSWLAGMDLVIGNDSGPIHFAAALGVPVLAVFGPTDPRRTGPYGAGHRVVVADVSCRPCHRRECRYAVTHCLEDIPASRVLSEALEMLDTRAIGNANSTGRADPPQGSGKDL